MSKLKSEIKVAIIRDLGNKYDDMLEGAKGNVYRHQGGKTYLKEGMKGVESLHSHLKADLVDGKFDGVDDAIKVAECIGKYIDRARNLLENIAIKAEVNIHISEGEVNALDRVVKLTKKDYDNEHNKLIALAEAEQEGLVETDEDGESKLTLEANPGRDRPVGVHPGNPIADRKSEGLEEVSKEESIVAEEEPKPRKRKTK